ncbi:hypothetical protein FOZ61_003817 [Perkinsus olseni]|uniref:Uncharacterized protein n=1 Tax=Perkinsus olseni TaxID=32597 RepID=A0A7J6LN90_PEROL|nr:hypothetical protein FOZ61_003817 [Perkinsus olseni]
MRGAVEGNVTLPEVLELLSNMLTKQTLNHEHHDTQVTVHECVSHSIHVRNSHTDVFARSGVDAAVQRTHHWSPLLKESAFVTTQRDRERHVYDTAKDRHIEPWLENMIRFGLVPFVKDESVAGNLTAGVVSVDEIVYHLMVSSLLSLNRDFCQDVRLDPGITVRVGRRPPPPGHGHAYNVTIESPYVARFQFELSSTASTLNEVWRLTSRSWGGTLISPRFSSMQKVNQNESADISPGDTIYISTSPQIGFVLYSPKAAAVTKPPRASEGEEELPDEHRCIICLVR